MPTVIEQASVLLDKGQVTEAFDMLTTELDRMYRLHMEAESSLMTWDDDLLSLYWKNHPDRAPEPDDDWEARNERR